MPIVVACSSCNSKLKAPDTAAGKRLKCPKCQSIINVPATAMDDGGFAPAPAAASMPPPMPNPPPPAPIEQPYTDDGDYEVRRPKRKKRSGGVPSDAPNKMTIGILAILLGGLGIHKFMLGYSKAGTIMLVVWIIGLFCTVGAASSVMGIIGLAEGIMYLTKSDEEFYETYVVNKKEWF